MISIAFEQHNQLRKAPGVRTQGVSEVRKRRVAKSWSNLPEAEVSGKIAKQIGLFCCQCLLDGEGTCSHTSSFMGSDSVFVPKIKRMPT